LEPLVVNARITLPADELVARAIRSGGPGGQNVNKVSTAIELRFDLGASTAFSAAQRTRLLAKLASRLVGGGVLSVRSTVHREQGRNLVDARERLAELLREALHVPRARRATAPTRGSQRRRLEAKKRTGSKKRLRGGGDGE
jgi:ribosome-associated protein